MCRKIATEFDKLACRIGKNVPWKLWSLLIKQTNMLAAWYTHDYKLQAHSCQVWTKLAVKAVSFIQKCSSNTLQYNLPKTHRNWPSVTVTSCDQSYTVGHVQEKLENACAAFEVPKEFWNLINNSTSKGVLNTMEIFYMTTIYDTNSSSRLP